MSKLFITGDTHGNIDIDKLAIKKFPFQKELTKNDILVVLGDWGAIWYGNKKDNYMIDWWNNKPWTTFVVLGNHCNYNAIEQLPKITMFGGLVRKVTNSVFIAITGEIYDFAGKKCLVINGADSTDKQYRVEGESWWRQERITPDDTIKALKSLYEVDGIVDFVFSHTGGSEVVKTLGFNVTPSDIELDKILNTATYQKHYCGHYHIDKLIDTTRILYDDIIMIACDD